MEGDGENEALFILLIKEGCYVNKINKIFFLNLTKIQIIIGGNVF